MYLDTLYLSKQFFYLDFIKSNLIKNNFNKILISLKLRFIGPPTFDLPILFWVVISKL